MLKLSVMGLSSETITEGLGLRKAIYCAGCVHQCYNCHNPTTWDINNGSVAPVQEVYTMLGIERNPLLSGITFTGGDPMFQARAFCELAQLIKRNNGLDIWCYTGYLYEELVKNRGDKYELLKHVDILVDGKYVDSLRDITLAFRGSSNQRIIDVQASLKQNAVVEVDLIAANKLP